MTSNSGGGILRETPGTPVTYRKPKKHSLQPQIYMQLELTSPKGKPIDPSTLSVLNNNDEEKADEFITHVRVEHCKGLPVGETTIRDENLATSGDDNPVVSSGTEVVHSRKERFERLAAEKAAAAPKMEGDNSNSPSPTSVIVKTHAGRHDHHMMAAPESTSNIVSTTELLDIATEGIKPTSSRSIFDASHSTLDMFDLLDEEELAPQISKHKIGRRRSLLASCGEGADSDDDTKESKSASSRLGVLRRIQSCSVLTLDETPSPPLVASNDSEVEADKATPKTDPPPSNRKKSGRRRSLGKEDLDSSVRKSSSSFLDESKRSKESVGENDDSSRHSRTSGSPRKRGDSVGRAGSDQKATDAIDNTSGHSRSGHSRSSRHSRSSSPRKRSSSAGRAGAKVSSIPASIDTSGHSKSSTPRKRSNSAGRSGAKVSSFVPSSTESNPNPKTSRRRSTSAGRSGAKVSSIDHSGHSNRRRSSSAGRSGANVSGSVDKSGPSRTSRKTTKAAHLEKKAATKENDNNSERSRSSSPRKRRSSSAGPRRESHTNLEDAQWKNVAFTLQQDPEPSMESLDDSIRKSTSSVDSNSARKSNSSLDSKKSASSSDSRKSTTSRSMDCSGHSSSPRKRSSSAGRPPRQASLTSQTSTASSTYSGEAQLSKGEESACKTPTRDNKDRRTSKRISKKTMEMIRFAVDDEDMESEEMQTRSEELCLPPTVKVSKDKRPSRRASTATKKSKECGDNDLQKGEDLASSKRPTKRSSTTRKSKDLVDGLGSASDHHIRSNRNRRRSVAGHVASHTLETPKGQRARRTSLQLPEKSKAKLAALVG